jgi:hypothetical protein
MIQRLISVFPVWRRFMPLFARALAAFFVIGGGTGIAQQTASPGAPKVIQIPYSMNWGDSVEKVRGMISSTQAKELSCTEKSPGKVVLEAEGLGIGDPLLKKTLFTFKDGSLISVELQYGNAGWDAEKTLDFFDRTRRRIDERYGTGTLIVNKVKEHPEGEKVPREMSYTLIIYQWNQPTVSLELNFYSVEDGDKSLRIVSLNYKTP